MIQMAQRLTLVILLAMSAGACSVEEGPGAAPEGQEDFDFEASGRPTTSGVLVNGTLTAEPPVAIHTRRGGAVAPRASGGGCRNTLNIGSCINAANGRLRGDFYYNFDNDLTDVALVALVRNSDDVPLAWYTTNLDHLGHYPILEWTYPNSRNAAYTVVDVYNNTFADANYQFSAPSPLYFYP